MELFKHGSLTTKTQNVYKADGRWYIASTYLQENGLIKTTKGEAHSFFYSLTLKGEVMALALYSFKSKEEDFREILNRSSDNARQFFYALGHGILQEGG